MRHIYISNNEVVQPKKEQQKLPPFSSEEIELLNDIKGFRIKINKYYRKGDRNDEIAKKEILDLLKKIEEEVGKKPIKKLRNYYDGVKKMDDDYRK